MKKTVRFLALFLALITVLTLASACAGGGTGENTDAQTENAGEVTTAPNETAAEPIRLTEGGGKDLAFVIIRPDAASDSVVDQAKRMRESIISRLGCRVNIGSDFLIPGKTHNADTWEILVGVTNYDETAKYCSEMRYNDYAVALEGHKIVVAAKSEGALSKAVNTFTSRVISAAEKKDDGDWYVSFENYVFSAGYKIDELTVNGKPFGDYVIVYGNETCLCKGAAATVAETLASVTGYLLPVVSDKTAPAPCEIVVGPSNRAQTGAGIYEYDVHLSDDRIIVDCGGGISADVAVRAMYSAVLAGGGKIDLDSSLSVKGSVPCEPGIDLTAGADIRVMSYNILAEKWGGYDTAARAEILGQVLRTWKPDVVGVQEVDDVWMKYIDRFSGDYRLVGSNCPDGAINYSQILYDSSRYEMTDLTVKRYSKQASVNCRNMCWALFTNKTTGLKFVFLSTHWDFGTEAEKEQMRKVQAEELAAKVKELKEKYGCPVFTTGDYNCNENSTSYKYFMEINDMYCSKFTAQKSYNSVGSCHTLMMNDVSSGSIDFVFATKENVSILGYKTVLENRVFELSDHLPVFADIQIKK